MGKRWAGIVVRSDNVTLVDAEVPATGPITIVGDHSWPLPKGDRPAAYAEIAQLVTDHVREHKINRVVMKGSAVSLMGTKKAHLEAAELRGVVAGAAAAITKTQMLAMAGISRNFGNRKADEYLKDDKFWANEVAGGTLRKGSREAALVLLAARDA
jgi:hypothetical protein